jgi:hypothetical protein
VTETSQPQNVPRWTLFFRVVNFTNLTAALTLATSLYTLLFLVRPNLKPPEKLGATIVKLRLEQDLTLEDYRQLTGTSTQEKDRAPSTEGTLIYVQIEIQGFQERGYGVFLTAINAVSMEEFAFPEGYNIDKCYTFTPEANTDRGVLRCWVAKPDKPGKYFVRVRLYDLGQSEELPADVAKEPQSHILDVADSTRYTVK